MKEIQGDIFSQTDADAICVTTNGVVKNNGELVMGAGIAKQFAMKYPGLAAHFGEQVKKHGNVPRLAVLGTEKWLGETRNPDYRVIVSFPTKHDWKDQSDIELIRESAFKLREWANYNYWQKVVLPRPGCGLGGLGGLKWEDVKKVIEPILDDRFYIITP